jgi:hypothetical protein
VSGVRSKATYTYTGTFRRRARSPRDRQRPAAAERCESGGEDASLGAISLAREDLKAESIQLAEIEILKIRFLPGQWQEPAISASQC